MVATYSKRKRGGRAGSLPGGWRGLRALLIPVIVLGAVGCATGQGGSRAEPAEAVPLAQSRPLALSGHRVLVLPVQQATEIPGGEGAIEREIAFALGERDGGATWIFPAELRRALRRAPGFARSPDALPADPLLHHGEPVAVEPLAGELRRYAALMDTRLVLLPLRATLVEERVQLAGALIDARSGAVLWRGEAQGEPGPLARAMATAAAMWVQGITTPVAGPGR